MLTKGKQCFLFCSRAHQLFVELLQLPVHLRLEACVLCLGIIQVYLRLVRLLRLVLKLAVRLGLEPFQLLEQPGRDVWTSVDKNTHKCASKVCAAMRAGRPPRP